MLLLLLLACAPSAHGLRAQGPDRIVSRRTAVGMATTSIAGLVTMPPAAAGAAAADEPARQALLDAIADDAPDADVLRAIETLVPLDPSKGRAASEAALDGKWRLLWSFGADKFSPLLGLPRPIRPTSLQLLGDPATATVGKGRVANLLCFPLGVRLLLSSGVLPAPDGPPSTLEIFPPFRLEVDALGGAARTQLVEAGSDADFRALNARDADAQAAPRNKYDQRYLDVSGAAGDLRISTVVSGDPVIVGSIFVHQRVL